MAAKTAIENRPRQAYKRVVLVPQYMKNFQCTGPGCQENCCETSWAIHVDKRTYQKYRKLKDKKLRALLDKQVTRNRSNPTDQKYAKLKLGRDGKCVFLDDNKLCALQRQLGEDYLCDTCTLYPRHSNLVEGVVETSASLSCPEVAQLVLFEEGGIEFTLIEEETHQRINLKKKLDLQDPRLKNSYIQYFWDLRRFTIELLQDREYILEDRLLFLGIFCKKLDEYIQDKKVPEIPLLVERYRVLAAEGSLRETLGQVPARLDVQMELLKEIADMRFKYPFVKNRVTGNNYLKYLAQFLGAVGYTREASLPEVGERYRQLARDYYRPFIEQHPYVLENYLVNYVFMTLFPLGDYRDVFDDYVMLTIQYGLLKMLLIGVAGHNRGLDEETVVCLVQSYITTTENNAFFLRDVYQKIKEKNFDTLAFMAILIKN